MGNYFRKPRNIVEGADEFCYCLCPLSGSVLLGIVLGFCIINHEPSLLSTLLSGHPALIPFNFVAFAFYLSSWTIAYIGIIFLVVVRPFIRAVRNRLLLPRHSYLPAEVFFEVCNFFVSFVSFHK